MRVLILGLNYLPESTSIGPYTAGLAEYLLTNGHQVQVITGFPMAPQWRVWDGYRRELFRHEIINQVSVWRTFLFVPKEPRKTLNRILFDLSFTCSALVAALWVGGCDVVVAISPPLQIGLTGWVISLLKRAPLFFHIQDLVPDAAIATGMLTEKSLGARIARWLEKIIYQRAQGIGVICAGFRANLLTKGVPPAQLYLLPNFINLDFMQTHLGDFRQQHGFKSTDFLIMYSGSVGGKQGLEVLIEAASQLQADSRLKIVIVGGGPACADLKQLAQHLNLTNVTFLPLQPRETLAQQLQAADVLIITQKRAVTDIVFPGKLLYYMAAGRPIVAAVSPESETGHFITSHQVGLVTPPEDGRALAQALRQLAATPQPQLGEQGRAVVEKNFDQRVVLPMFEKVLKGLAN